MPANNTALKFPESTTLVSPIALRLHDRAKFSEDLGRFLDTIGTATGRATHYNTREEQEAAETKVHSRLFAYDPALYAALLNLPGTLDRAKQYGTALLLANKIEHPVGCLPITKERGKQIEANSVTRMLKDLPVPRMLKALCLLKDARINNASTRRIIMTCIFDTEHIEHRAVKYRELVGSLLEHALNKNRGWVKDLVGKPAGGWSPADVKHLNNVLFRFYPRENKLPAQIAVAFALGVKTDFVKTCPNTPLVKAFYEAHTDLEAGRGLPYEVLEGIRGRYHKDVPTADVLEMTKKTLTKGQRKNVQAQAQKSNVKVLH